MSFFRWVRSLGGDEQLKPTSNAIDSMSPNAAHPLNRARRLASHHGEFEAALMAYRETVAASPLDGRVLLEYARFLVERSCGSAAEEVLATLLARDGAQVDALEIYLELVRELDLPQRRRNWALKRLSADIPTSPHEYRGALDYAIPHRLQGVLDVIGTSSDPVDRAIVAINARLQEGTLSDTLLTLDNLDLSANDQMRAILTVTLARGNRAAAIPLLNNADTSAIPLNALRRAIRRARSAGKGDQAIQYLKQYQRLKPDDSWSTNLLNDYQDEPGSNLRLARTGFPLPTARDVPAYASHESRVFYLLHNSLPYHSAGYATRTHGLLTELNRSGWDVEGVTRLGYPYDMPGKADIPEVLKVDVQGPVTYRRLLRGREIEKKNPLFFYTERYSSVLLELAMERRPAIIHAASNHWNGLTAVKTARQLGLPSVYEVRGLWEITRGSRDPEWLQSDKFRFMANMEADAAKGATKVLTITESLRAEMISRGVDEQKISVVPNGVDTNRFTPLHRDEELATQLGVSGKTVIGYVGSILDYEGIDLLIEAARVLNSARTDFHVLIVGDGTELDSLKAHVQDSGLESVVTFTGRVPHEEVERYYSLIDITPFPRHPLPVCEMVSPLKPFEAMAMGKAVVASDVAALAEIVQPDVTGLLHAKGSNESLVEQLDRLLNQPSLRAHLGSQAREWVVSERDWSALALSIAEIYRGIL